MRRSRAVGRPSVWHKPILDFVDNHGSARALEIRQALGISKPSFYKAVAALICTGSLCWCRSDTGNYRLLKTTKTQPTSLMLRHSDYVTISPQRICHIRQSDFVTGLTQRKCHIAFAHTCQDV